MTSSLIRLETTPCSTMTIEIKDKGFYFREVSHTGIGFSGKYFPFLEWAMAHLEAELSDYKK